MIELLLAAFLNLLELNINLKVSEIILLQHIPIHSVRNYNFNISFTKLKYLLHFYSTHKSKIIDTLSHNCQIKFLFCVIGQSITLHLRRIFSRF